MKSLATMAISLGLVLAASGCKKTDNGSSAGSASGSGSGAAPGAGGTIKIVSSLPRTGSANAQTTTIVNGIKLAIAEAGGKAGGFDIVYEDWDDASAKKADWDGELEAANADKAIKDPDVMVYIGTYNSGAAKISMPVLNRAGLVMISPANTGVGLTKPGMGDAGEPGIYRPSGKITYFRVVPTDDLQGSLGAQWMKDMGAKSVYILDDRQVYGKGLADIVEQTAGDIGLTVLGHEGIDPKAQEYKSLMIKIKDKNPDFVYFGGTTQSNAGQLAKDMVAVGLKAKLMVPDGCFEDAFITASGADNVNDRAFITFGGFPPDKLEGQGAEFVKRYVAKYGAQPQAYAVYGYVAAKVALAAIDRAGKKDRQAIVDAVAQTDLPDSALGPFKFDANGDTTMHKMSGNTVKDGKFAFVQALGK
jgi:branched-chain amino acid transport system substrate-binding protein